MNLLSKWEACKLTGSYMPGMRRTGGPVITHLPMDWGTSEKDIVENISTTPVEIAMAEKRMQKDVTAYAPGPRVIRKASSGRMQ